MIELIGTHHLMRKEEIEKIIIERNPDIIGVELCKTRFKIFTGQINNSNEKDESLMGSIADEIKKKAKENNLDYGSDMKTAMFYAINNNIPLILVDMDIIEIRNNMLKIPLEEQLYLQKELIKFQQENINTEINEDEVIKQMKEHIPVSYKILVEDRNNHIINELKKIEKENKDKKILVFLGKGHIKEIKEKLL